MQVLHPSTVLILKLQRLPSKIAKRLTLAVARRLYQGEEGRGNDALETNALHARITCSTEGWEAIIQPWHDSVASAKSEKDWPQRHPSALSKQIRDQAAAEKRVERARGISQFAQYRRSLHVLMYFSP